MYIFNKRWHSFVKHRKRIFLVKCSWINFFRKLDKLLLFHTFQYLYEPSSFKIISLQISRLRVFNIKPSLSQCTKQPHHLIRPKKKNIFAYNHIRIGMTKNFVEVFHCTLKIILAYDCESWTLGEAGRNRIVILNKNNDNKLD